MMFCSRIFSISNLNQNESLVKELIFERSNMTKVNITSDISTLFYHIPVILIVIIVNISCVILFRKLEQNFAYKMVICDSINNILYALAFFYRNSYKPPFPFPPFCALTASLSYGFLTLNRLVPLVIVLHRYVCVSVF